MRAAAGLLLLSLAAITIHEAFTQNTTLQISKNPWPAILATVRTTRPSALYKFTDYAIPRDPSIRTKCLAKRFCNCTITGGYNQTFWLNTASAMFNGQLYLAILQRTVSLKTNVTYHSNNKSMRGQVVEMNTLLICKAQLLEKLKVVPKDCKLLEPGPGYKEKHPYTDRGFWFELNGLIDPRLVSAGDGSGLFLQAGCRPMHMSYNHNGTKFKEGLCLVKLEDGVPGAGGRRQQLQQQQRSLQAQMPEQLAGLQPGYPLPGITILSADWPKNKLTSLTSANGFASWEKSWIAFEYQGTLLWNRHLSPQQVVTVHANGTASNLYKHDNKEVFRPLKTVCGSGPRGNTPAIRLSKELSKLPRDVYLGILHYTPHRKGNSEPLCHEYLNFFYLMDGEPPFQILEVARPPIPILASTNPVLDSPPLSFGMGYISFPTGMVVIDKQVMITYGSGDAELRVWYANLADILATFYLSTSNSNPGWGTTTATAATV